MNDENRQTGARTLPLPQNLRTLSLSEFASLGAGKLVFSRILSGTELGRLLPDAAVPPDGEYHMILSADGAPLMVTDSSEQVDDWLDHNDLDLATRH